MEGALQQLVMWSEEEGQAPHGSRKIELDLPLLIGKWNIATYRGRGGGGRAGLCRLPIRGRSKQARGSVKCNCYRKRAPPLSLLLHVMLALLLLGGGGGCSSESCGRRRGRSLRVAKI